MITNPKTAYSKREKFIDDFGGQNNNVYTPEEAIYPLLPYLKKENTIWDCAFGSGRLAEHFAKFGFKVIGQKDINFLSENDGYVDTWDILITNPPYSFKDQFLKRAFELNRPFAFLLPLTTLEGIKRGNMFREHHIQLIIPDRRINFEIPSGKKSSWFATAWFCYGLNLPKDLMFVSLTQERC
jgi:hypothetical protein